MCMEGYLCDTSLWVLTLLLTAFGRSPKEAQDSAREAAKLVEPGMDWYWLK